MNLKIKLKSVKMKHNIKKVDKQYESQFLLEIEEMKKLNIPKDYIDFLINIGCGEFEAVLSLNCEILKFDDIFDENDTHLEGMYIFASDLADTLFAFDSKNNWQIVEIDSSGEILDVVAKTFTEFMDKKLDEILEIEEYGKFTKLNLE